MPASTIITIRKRELYFLFLKKKKEKKAKSFPLRFEISTDLPPKIFFCSLGFSDFHFWLQKYGRKQITILIITFYYCFRALHIRTPKTP